MSEQAPEAQPPQTDQTAAQHPHARRERGQRHEQREQTAGTEQQAPPMTGVTVEEQQAAEVSQPVASNAEPTTEHDDYATEARDAAVDEIAGRYEENGDSEAAEKVRARLKDSPASEDGTVVHDAGPGETTAGGAAAPTV